MPDVPMRTPFGIKLFGGLCVFFGSTGTLLGFLFIAIGLSHPFASLCQSLGQDFLASIRDLLRNLGMIIGGIWVLRRRNWARNLIMIIAAAGILELGYNTRTQFRAGIENFPFLYYFGIMFVFLFDAVLIYYFSRKSTRLMFSKGEQMDAASVSHTVMKE